MAVETSKAPADVVGNYELLEKIAEGGMGSVYRGRHRDTGQIVAIKIVPATTASNPVLLKRFEQEFRAASTLDHPHIVRAIDYGESDNSPFLVMEFVDGDSLGKRIERNGAIPEAEAIRLIAQVAQGLHRAHKQGLIHRDVKPDNILINAEGDAKLADLGLVKEVETDLNLTRTGRGLGTPHFMAPEQFRNAKHADVRCDIYSLGATLYMMVTGELPFRGLGPLDAWMKKMSNDLPTARTLVPALSERVDWAIRRAMSADPEMRPATCREFVEDLIGHSTRRLPTLTGGSDLWYLIYQDTPGETHTVKGSTLAIRRSIKEGLLGEIEHVRACRTKSGTFEPLRTFPEFRDLVMAPAALHPAPAAQPKTEEPAAASVDTPPEEELPVPPMVPAPPASNMKVPHIRFNANVPQALPQWVIWAVLFLIGFAAATLVLFLTK
jgi:eukaryotic-like serine/threonine-protein kinase